MFEMLVGRSLLDEERQPPSRRPFPRLRHRRDRPAGGLRSAAPGSQRSLAGLDPGRGGTAPFWRSDGGELFFVSADAELSAVAVRPSPGSRSLSCGRPEVLFRLHLKDHGARQIDTVDGRTFVVNRTVTRDGAEPLTLRIGVGGLGKEPR
jgi:hypothetical protein